MGEGGSATASDGAWYRRAGRWAAGLDPLVADTVLALALAVPLLVDLRDTTTPGPPLPFRDADPLGYVLVGLLVLPLALRRRYPLAVFVVILSAAITTTLLAYHPASFGFGLIVATYTVARWCDRPASIAALVLALGFSVFVKVRFIVAGVDIGWFEWPLDAAYFAGGWFLGDAIRARSEQTEELQRNREALARQAVEREHLRIARELHDSVGHALSLMVLYAGAAERVSGQDPARARALLETMGSAGRNALEEMDRMVGVLRHEAPGPATVTALEALAEEFRVLGLPVAVSVTGDPGELPEEVDTTAFRIAQEALTNTLKHADATLAEVRLDCRPPDLTVSVVDDGAGSVDRADGATDRHGLTGMRERVLTLGGELEAGPRSGRSGFSVSARLPFTPGAAS